MKYFVGFVTLLLAVDFGLGGLVRQESPLVEFDTVPNYSYGYSVSDPITGDSKRQEESRVGDVVRGQYSVLDPDGTLRTVTYTADATGFHAVVNREGAGVAVVEPKPVLTRRVVVAQPQPSVITAPVHFQRPHIVHHFPYPGAATVVSRPIAFPARPVHYPVTHPVPSVEESITVNDQPAQPVQPQPAPVQQPGPVQQPAPVQPVQQTEPAQPAPVPVVQPNPTPAATEQPTTPTPSEPETPIGGEDAFIVGDPASEAAQPQPVQSPRPVNVRPPPPQVQQPVVEDDATIIGARRADDRAASGSRSSFTSSRAGQHSFTFSF